MANKAPPRKFKLQFLQEITDNFSKEHEIGCGAYGIVYKGVIDNGVEIAIKKLLYKPKPGLAEKEFRNELNNLERAQHPNIVRLVGFCSDAHSQTVEHEGKLVSAQKEEKIFCFEYMQGGSLHKHITDESCGLDWHTCYKIIKGVCAGLNHLHNGSGDFIYHLDLKPANILLDKDMTPKICDFGLSRIFHSAETQVTANIIGTLGYMPPEYFNGQITSKFDVFSLGITIIQMMAGSKGHSRLVKMPSQEFIKLVHEDWLKRSTPTMSSQTLQEVQTCIEIAVRCVDNDRSKRPEIKEIVDKLNKIGDSKSSCAAQVLSSCSNTLEELPGNTQFEHVQIVRMKKYAKIVSVDVHKEKPWILITHFEDHFRIINYQAEEIVMPHIVERAQEGLSFLTAKFIERKQWIVAGGCDYRIYVFRFSDDTMEKVTKFMALTQQVTSLAIHPTKSYVLSASYDYGIGLWDWEKKWKSARKFDQEHSGSVMQIAFNPKNPNTFGSVSKDETVKIWGIDSSHSNNTLDKHESNVRCLHYFTRDDKQYLITGSDDKTAKIWDLQINECVETLKGHKGRVTAVCSHPKPPVLMTGSYDGTVCFWNSNTFRLIKRIPESDLGKVHALDCIEGPRRVVIGHSRGLTIMEIP